MTAPHFDTEHVTVWHGDCIDVMRDLPDASVDAVCTDPPYALEFMGKGWDTYTPLEFEAWCAEWAAECLRLLKPGGHLLAFGGTRTFHRLAAGIEDAGFEIRDSIAWLYGSGFPKSLDVSKAIDKIRDDTEHHAAVARFLVDRMNARGITRADINRHFGFSTAGSGAAQQWTTTATDRVIKPRVPTWDQWQQLRELVGIDSPDMDAEVWRLNGRKGTPGEAFAAREVLSERTAEVKGGSWAEMAATGRFRPGSKLIQETAPHTEDAARWQGWGTALKPAFEPIVVARKPLSGTVAANVLQHGTGALNIDASRIGHASEADLATSQAKNPGRTDTVTSGIYGASRPQQSVNAAGRWPANVILDGSQKFDEARYFYTPKADSFERPNVDGIAHPTVKPVDLMRWLVKLVTPKGGTVLEPFAGSGTTVEAAVLEGFRCIAIEREADYLPLIMQRVSKPHAVGLDFGDWEDAS